MSPIRTTAQGLLRTGSLRWLPWSGIWASWWTSPSVGSFLYLALRHPVGLLFWCLRSGLLEVGVPHDDGHSQGFLRLVERRCSSMARLRAEGETSIREDGPREEIPVGSRVGESVDGQSLGSLLRDRSWTSARATWSEVSPHSSS